MVRLRFFCILRSQEVASNFVFHIYKLLILLFFSPLLNIQDGNYREHQTVFIFKGVFIKVTILDRCNIVTQTRSTNHHETLFDKILKILLLCIPFDLLVVKVINLI